MENVGRSLNENDNGSVEVQSGVVMVKNLQGTGEYAIITNDGNGKLYINGKRILESVVVKESDEIVYSREDVKGKRIIEIKTSEDKTEENISIDRKKLVKIKIL
ncbi:MAG: hypothetical protein ACRC68_00120 [Clostridium sp.]